MRLVYLGEIGDNPLVESPAGDALSYDEWGARIAGGDWFGDEVFYQAPAYPYLLGLIYAIGGHDLGAVHLVQMLLGALSCVWIFLAGRHLFGLSAGIVAGLLLAVYPSAIFFDGLIQKSGLGLFLLTLLLFLLARTFEKASAWRFLGCGLTLGLLALTRENMLVLLLVLPAWILLRSAGGDGEQRLRRAGSLLLGAALVLGPVGARNRIVGSELLITTSQLGSNFYIGNSPRATGLYVSLVPGRQDPMYERADATRLAEQSAGRKLASGEVSDYWLGRGMEFVRSEPGAWLSLMGRKLLLIWNHFEFPDAEDQYAYAEWSSLLGVLDRAFHFGILAPLGLAGAVLSWRRRREAWLLYFLLFFFTASVALFYVFARYRFPLAPVLILLAGNGLVEARSAARARRWKVLAGAMLVALLAAFVVNVPLVNEAQFRAVSFVNMGTICADAGRDDEAVRFLERAFELDPRSPAAHRELGRIRSEQGRFEEAEKHLSAAATLAEGWAAPQLDLARMFSRRGDAERAADHYRAALRRAPDLREARAELVGLLRSIGSHAEAVETWRVVTESDPSDALARLQLGLLLEEAGRAGEASREIEEALRLDPSLARHLESAPEAR